jgi:hypothetical protein
MMIKSKIPMLIICLVVVFWGNVSIAQDNELKGLVRFLSNGIYNISTAFVFNAQHITNKNRCRAADTLFGCWTSPEPALYSK